jgi:hypothetical protein
MWLDSALKSLGFQQSLHEVGIYGHGGDRARKLIGMTWPSQARQGRRCNAYKFSIKDERSRDPLLLPWHQGASTCQQHHDESGELCQGLGELEVVGMANCNMAHTPMEEKHKLSQNSEAMEVDTILYQEVCEHVPAAPYGGAHGHGQCWDSITEAMNPNKKWKTMNSKQ